MAQVLADTSIWVAHFRKANPGLQFLLQGDQVLCHPLVIVEIACGTPPSPRQRTLADLQALRQPAIARQEEVLTLIEREGIADSGCGAVDAMLLASVLLTPGVRLWTADRPLGALGRRLKVAFDG